MLKLTGYEHAHLFYHLSKVNNSALKGGKNTLGLPLQRTAIVKRNNLPGVGYDK
jgi:hypothetical protein